MKLGQVLFSQGFGTRRECAALMAAGRVADAQGQPLDDAERELALEGLVIQVDGQPWPVHDKALLMLHKPAAYECSQKPGRWPGVLGLLPAPLRQRGVQPVGRLDVDTTGLLLLTDDGSLLHRLTHPRRHVPKVYQVRVTQPLHEDQLRALRDGVMLHGEPKPARALHAQATGECTLSLTIDEGRYHQVKRMLAAVGHHVQALHRSQVGGLALPDDLAPDQWRWLTPDDRQALLGGP